MPELSCYRKCKDDSPGDAYMTSCKKITRKKGVANRGCAWQQKDQRYSNVVTAILDSQNHYKVNVDECSDDLNMLCTRAIEFNKFKGTTVAECVQRLKDEDVTRVCFCSSDFCNSSPFLESTFVSTISFSLLTKFLFG